MRKMDKQTDWSTEEAGSQTGWRSEEGGWWPRSELPSMVCV
jgi:hypothetical protein